MKKRREEQRTNEKVLCLLMELKQAVGDHEIISDDLTTTAS